VQAVLSPNRNLSCRCRGPVFRDPGPLGWPVRIWQFLTKDGGRLGFPPSQIEVGRSGARLTVPVGRSHAPQHTAMSCTPALRRRSTPCP
jgi:hypothetical protein